MPKIFANGIRLHYVDFGDASETVVLSHSFLVDLNQFAAQIEALSSRFRVLAYDHRDHGKSEKPSNGYSMNDVYTDGTAFIEAMNLAPCHWIGLSTGGFVGSRIAIRRPDLLRSLVLMDTSADAEPKINRIKYALMLATLRLCGFQPVIGTAMKSMFAPKFLHDATRQEERAKWRRRMLANDRRSIIRFGQAIFKRRSVYEELHQIETPTLVIAGEKDAAIPLFKARRLAAAIPGADLEVIAAGGHLCTIEEPAAVNRVLTSFLGAQA
jgi:pimeloyl-ACP methyl ester carboxylesterase